MIASVSSKYHTITATTPPYPPLPRGVHYEMNTKTNLK